MGKSNLVTRKNSILCVHSFCCLSSCGSSAKLNWWWCRNRPVLSGYASSLTSIASTVDNNEVIPFSSSLNMAKAVKYLEDMIVFHMCNARVLWGVLTPSDCHVSVDGSPPEAKWADGAWFSFLLACGWCNWSRQSEDGMIPPLPPHRDTLISPPARQ